MEIKIEKILTEMISIPSPFLHEEKITLYLEKNLKDMGFKTSRQVVRRSCKIDGKIKRVEHFNVLGEKGSGSKSFLLYGHADTVPPVDAWEEMGIDPYCATIQGNKLIGLGASDMKGGLAAILKAAHDLNPENYKLKICFGVDEENESAGAYELINSDFIDDCAGCIVTEVGSGNVEPAPGNVMLGRHGRNRVGVRIRGKAAHASTPAQAVNPVKYALEFIELAETIDPGDDPDMPPGNVTVSGIQAHSKGLSSPEECLIWFDNLFCPPVTSNHIFQQYRDLCSSLNEKYSGQGKNGTGFPRFSVIDLANLTKKDALKFSARSTPFMEPWKISADSHLAKSAAEAVKKVLGRDPVFVYGKSNADENYIGMKIPTVVIPPVGGNEHQAGEYVLIDSLYQTAEIVKNTVKFHFRN